MPQQANTLGRNVVAYFGTEQSAGYPEQKQKRTYLRYWGRTTNNTPTEIFLGGRTNARPKPTPGSTFFIRWAAAATNSTNEANSAVNSGVVGFRCASNGTLTVLADGTSSNMPAASTIAVTWDAFNNQPRVRVTGLASATIDWLLDADMTESTIWGLTV